MKKVLLFSLLSLAIANNSFAAKSSLSNLKKELQRKNHSIKSLKKNISSIENELNAKNNSIIELIERKRVVEEKITALEKKMLDKKAIVEESIEKINKAIRAALIVKLSNGSDAKTLLTNQIIVKQLNNRKKQLVSDMDSLNKMDVKVSDLTNKFQTLSNLEDDLSNVIQNLENKKSKIAENYIKTVKEKDSTQKEYDQLRVQRYVAKKKAASKRKGIYKGPIDNFIGMDYDKKGVTFHFRGQQTVKAGRKGKILYAGTLSSYGNVVMIDHGKSVRSVLLGQFIPQVKKGATVNVGQKIGVTDTVTSKTGKVYFEVRSKDKIENTIVLLDKKSIAKR